MNIIVIIISVVALLAIAIAMILWNTQKSQQERMFTLEKENSAQSIQVDNLRTEVAKIESLQAKIEDLNKSLQSAMNNNATLEERSNALADERLKLNGEIEKQRIAIDSLTAQLHNTKNENATLSERLNILSEEQARIDVTLNTKFKEIANDILTNKSEMFKKSNEERLTEILTPLRENIDNFKKSIQEKYNLESIERNSLKNEISRLMELNSTISSEAKELTNALKGNTKIQGNWGEQILDKILENSGLRENEEYFKQEHITGANGKTLIPDVIVKFPDGKNIIIDSKVSIVAFTKYVNSTTDEERDAAAKEHVLSVRKHVDELSAKEYQKIINDGVEFVMMFIPNEGAYMSAMDLDNSLWEYAYNKQVVIVSPTHLITAMKMVIDLWKRDRQTKNAIKIATESGKMYDKFVGFVSDMQNIGKGINNTQNAYEQALNKLKSGQGNLIKRAENIRSMGAATTKMLCIKTEEEDNESSQLLDDSSL